MLSCSAVSMGGRSDGGQATIGAGDCCCCCCCWTVAPAGSSPLVSRKELSKSPAWLSETVVASYVPVTSLLFSSKANFQVHNYFKSAEKRNPITHHPSNMHKYILLFNQVTIPEHEFFPMCTIRRVHHWSAASTIHDLLELHTFTRK